MIMSLCGKLDNVQLFLTCQAACRMRFHYNWLDDVRDSLRGYSRRGMLYIIPPTHHVVLISEDRFPQGKVFGGIGIAGRSVL